MHGANITLSQHCLPPKPPPGRIWARASVGERERRQTLGLTLQQEALESGGGSGLSCLRGKVTLETEFRRRPVKPGLRPEEPSGQDRWPPTGQRVRPSHRAHHLFLSSQQQTALRKKENILFGRAELAVSPGRKTTRPHWAGWVAAWALHRRLVGR